MGCAGTAGTVAETPPLLGGGFGTGEVVPLNFDPSGQAQLNFGELSGGEEFTLLFFAANVNEGSFGIELQSGNGSQSSSPTQLLRAPSTLLPQNSFETSDPTSLFHSFLRQEEAIIGQVLQDSGSEKFFSAQNEGGQSSLKSYDIPCAGRAGTLIKVLNSMSNTDSFDIICGIEKRTTDNAIYYVDEAALGVLPDGLLDQIINDFESKIDRERSLLGRESDVNGDGRFAVCFCPGVNRLGATVGGYITGFFYGGDLFSLKSLPASNEKEILFISVPDPNGIWGIPVATDFWTRNIAPSVIPHEFQHMINYQYKVLEHEIGAENTWANEGISHLMEDLNGNTSDPLQSTGMENPSRVGLFLQSPESASFTGGTSLAQRGGAYLFFRYLYEQANLQRYPGVGSGEEFLRQLIQSPEKGVANIETTTGWTFQNLLLDFYASLQLSHTGITANPRYNFQGINLFGDQNDNRGTILSGVQGQALDHLSVKGAVSSPGGIFFNVQGNTLKNAGKAIHFIAEPGMIPGGAVIRIK